MHPMYHMYHMYKTISLKFFVNILAKVLRSRKHSVNVIWMLFMQTAVNKLILLFHSSFEWIFVTLENCEKIVRFFLSLLVSFFAWSYAIFNDESGCHWNVNDKNKTRISLLFQYSKHHIQPAYLWNQIKIMAKARCGRKCWKSWATQFHNVLIYYWTKLWHELAMREYFNIQHHFWNGAHQP